MQKQGKKINGIDSVDTPQMAAMRATVVEQELSARSWKAYFEKMHYALESEKLEPLYKEYQERQKARMEAEKKQMEDFMAALNKEIETKNQGDTEGTINLEEAN